MEPTEVLKQHLELCNDVHRLLLEENTWLKVQKKVPEMKFLEEKKVIVQRLEDSLSNQKKRKSSRITFPELSELKKNISIWENNLTIPVYEFDQFRQDLPKND